MVGGNREVDNAFPALEGVIDTLFKMPHVKLDGKTCGRRIRKAFGKNVIRKLLKSKSFL